MTSGKRVIVFSLLGLILLIAGSFIAVDWMIFLYQIKTIYAGVAKPATSFICLLLVLLIGADGIDRRGAMLHNAFGVVRKDELSYCSHSACW